MTFEEYHAAVGQFASYPERGNNLVYPALGAAGEAGELAEKVKKLWRNHGITGSKQFSDAHISEAALTLRRGLLKEIGDVLWYLDALAYEAGSTLGEVALLNAEKLADRNARNVLKSEGDDR